MQFSDAPQEVKACLWSYDTSRIDLSNTDHRRRIIENILNRGTKPAVEWLMTQFDVKEIAEVIVRSNTSTWNKKSLALWSLVFGAVPKQATRFG